MDCAYLCLGIKEWERKCHEIATAWWDKVFNTPNGVIELQSNPFIEHTPPLPPKPLRKTETCACDTPLLCGKRHRQIWKSTDDFIKSMKVLADAYAYATLPLEEGEKRWRDEDQAARMLALYNSVS